MLDFSEKHEFEVSARAFKVVICYSRESLYRVTFQDAEKEEPRLLLRASALSSDVSPNSSAAARAVAAAAAPLSTSSSPPPAPTSSSASTNYSELAALASSSPPSGGGGGQPPNFSTSAMTLGGADSGIEGSSRGLTGSSSVGSNGAASVSRGLVGRPHLRDDDRRPLWNSFNRQVRR